MESAGDEIDITIEDPIMKMLFTNTGAILVNVSEKESENAQMFSCKSESYLRNNST